VFLPAKVYGSFSEQAVTQESFIHNQSHGDITLSAAPPSCGGNYGHHSGMILATCTVNPEILVTVKVKDRQIE
jgi:hypothetical protein